EHGRPLSFPQRIAQFNHIRDHPLEKSPNSWTCIFEPTSSTVGLKEWFVIPEFRVIRVFRDLNKCEAKSIPTAVAFACSRDRIFSGDVFQSFAGPSDIVSNENTDQCRRCGSQNHSVRKWTIGSVDCAIPAGTI